MSDLVMAKFPKTYKSYPTAVGPKPWPSSGAGTPVPGPKCTPEGSCFVASHVPPGGPWLINTYLNQPDKKYVGPAGAAAVREGMLCRNT
jgi:hypothetical protein